MPDSSKTQTRAIFFDRDGVINRRIKGGYVRKWSEFELNAELATVLAEVKRLGYRAIIITNQRGVGKGLMTEAELIEIHEELQRRMANAAGTQFDDILYCTDLATDAPRRKPSPAMLLEAAERWNIDLAKSWMIGDTASDIEAGKRAGTRTAFLVTEHTDIVPDATRVVHSLNEFVRQIQADEDQLTR